MGKVSATNAIVWKASRDDALIIQLGKALGRPIGDPTALSRFAGLVATWSARVNLTGAKEARALAEILFTDACVLAEVVPRDARVLDVGSGAGAPAIPLAILRPDLSLTLVEPLRKRVAFLRTAIGTLDLGARARVEEQRLESPAPFAGRFDVAMSRATFEPAEWLERGLAIAPRVIVMSGAEPLPDVASAERIETREYALAFSGSPRRIGLYRAI